MEHTLLTREQLTEVYFDDDVDHDQNVSQIEDGGDCDGEELEFSPGTIQERR